MTRFVARRLLGAMVVATSLMGAPSAEAAESPIGTYLKKVEAGKPSMTLTIGQWGLGKAKLTYRIQDPPIVLTIASALDGTEAPVLINGKASGETMAIKRLDNLHSSTIVKMNGKPLGTSKGTFSPDFTTLTVENDFSGSGARGMAGKSTERWIRK
jgi:hypothetical protein